METPRRLKFMKVQLQTITQFIQSTQSTYIVSTLTLAAQLLVRTGSSQYGFPADRVAAAIRSAASALHSAQSITKFFLSFFYFANQKTIEK